MRASNILQWLTEVTRMFVIFIFCDNRGEYTIKSIGLFLHLYAW